MGIGNIRKSIFGDCEFFLSDFPYNTAHVTLPFVIFDNLGIGCVGGTGSRIFNAIAHLGATVGLILAAQTKFSQWLGEFFEGIIGKNPKSAAFLLYYGTFNIALILLEFIAAAARPTDPNKLPSPTKCILSPISCAVDFFKWLGHNVKPRLGKPLTCKPGQVYDAGLCYRKATTDENKNYEFAGPIGWARCPKTGFTDDGAYCLKRDSYNRGVGKVLSQKCTDPNRELWGGLCYKKCPTGSKRTASCTCNFGKYHGVYTNCKKGVFPPKPKLGSRVGEPCTGLNWSKVGKSHQIYKDKGVGWMRTAICTCQKGGIQTNCGLWGNGKVSTKYCDPKNPDRQASLCYPKPKPGYKCIGLACSRICPPHTINIGVSCQKKTISRGVGKPISACPAGSEKIVALCYERCELKYGPEFERKGLLCIRKTANTPEARQQQMIKINSIKNDLVHAQTLDPTNQKIKEQIIKIDNMIKKLS